MLFTAYNCVHGISGDGSTSPEHEENEDRDASGLVNNPCEEKQNRHDSGLFIIVSFIIIFHYVYKRIYYLS